MAPKKAFNPLAARIKRMMQRDEDVGKIANGAPVVLARAMELFVKQLTTTTCDVAVLHGAKTIQATHLKGAIAMVPEAFDFLSDVVEGVADLPPPPDLNAMEAELKEKEMDDDATAGAMGKRKKSKASGGSLEMGSLGAFGGSLDDEAPKKKKSKGTSGSKKSTTTSRGGRRRVKKEEYDDEEEEEEDFEDLSETDEEFDPDAPVPKRETTRSRSGRTVRKTYTDDFVEEEEEEEEKPTAAPMASFDAVGSLGGAGTLDAQATEIGADEDDYD